MVVSWVLFCYVVVWWLCVLGVGVWFLLVLFDGFGGFAGLCVLGVYCRVLWAGFFLILLVWVGLCWRGCLGVFDLLCWLGV